MSRSPWIIGLLALIACNNEGPELEPKAIEEAERSSPEAAAPPVAAPSPAEREWPNIVQTPAPGARLYSKTRFLWIYAEPSDAGAWIAYLSLGDWAPLRGGSAATAKIGPGQGSGCAEWYAVEPRGYACAGEDASLDGNDPDILELQKRIAKPAPLPYSYGESTGTAVYLAIPPRRRQYFRESAFNEHMAEVQRARAASTPEEKAAIHPDLVGVDLATTGNEPAPDLLLRLPPGSRVQTAPGKYGFPEVIRGSTIAYTHSFDADDRTWVMTWDRGLIPKDRIKVYPESKFHGVPLGDGVELPLAFFRKDEPQLRRTSSGVEPTGGTWPRYGFIGLTGEEVEHLGVRYLITKESGLLCQADAVSAPALRTDLPEQVAAGAASTWLDVSIVGGWLVAYEKNRPVYTTMVSPGRGGLPVEGKTLLETASTPVGDFPISGKFHTATMTSNFSDKVVHAEVPYTQNFSGPYALHAAYWHDDWGVPKSGGCVNLAPIDAMRIFAWTEPRLPPGWHGMRGVKSDAQAYASATIVSTHR